MKNYNKILRIVCASALVAISFAAKAFSFEYTYEGLTLKYTAIDQINMYCEVSALVDGGEAYDEKTLNLIIPEKVEFNGVEFTVTSIGESAFEYNEGIYSVVLPPSIQTIKKYAFSCCSKTEYDWAPWPPSRWREFSRCWRAPCCWL